MCGIVGIINSTSFDSRESIELLVSALSHRGPDASGLYVSPGRNVFFGNTRLSIIDPSPSNNQPFETAKTVIVFNGEVYNHRELRESLKRAGVSFGTEGDTEVIARGFECWGLDLFRRTKGMYAIAIYEKDSGSVYLARDMFGIKPLYVSQTGDELRFASEVKALQARHSYEINHETLFDLMTLGFHVSNNSIFKSVQQVPPGMV